MDRKEITSLLAIMGEAKAANEASNHKEAVDLYVEAISILEAGLVDLHVARASSWMSAGETDRALIAAQTAIKRNPTTAAAFFWMGSALLEKDQVEDAKRAFKKAIRLEKDPKTNAMYAEGLARCEEELEGMKPKAAAAEPVKSEVTAPTTSAASTTPPPSKTTEAASDATSKSTEAVSDATSKTTEAASNATSKTTEAATSKTTEATSDATKDAASSDTAEAAPQPAAPQPATPPQPQGPPRMQWYQSVSYVNVDVYARNVVEDESSVTFTDNTIQMLLRRPGSEDYSLEVELAENIVPDDSSYSMSRFKVEVRLKKARGSTWKSLDADGKIVSAAIEASLLSRQRENRNTERQKGLAQMAEQELKDYNEDDSAMSMFRLLYKDADEDTRRAMMKSYSESGGQVLSTNWNEVANKKVVYEGTE